MHSNFCLKSLYLEHYFHGLALKHKYINIFLSFNRYINNLTVGSIGGGVGSGGDNNSITTGTGSVISSSIGATGSEGSSTPIASPPSSIHGVHPLSKKKPINSPPYVINSSSSSVASSGMATGTNGRRRNKEPPPSEISV